MLNVFVQAELRMQNIKNVIVHNLSVQIPGTWDTVINDVGPFQPDSPLNGLSCNLLCWSEQPGMVTTDLLMSGGDTRQASLSFHSFVCTVVIETSGKHLLE